MIQPTRSDSDRGGKAKNRLRDAVARFGDFICQKYPVRFLSGTTE